MCLFKREQKKRENNKGIIQERPQKGTVDYNAERMKKKYPLDKWGYFGEEGKNRRVIYSKNQIKESGKFYSRAGKGGKEIPLDNGRGKQKIMKDGGVVTYREKTSTPNSPAVDFGKMTGKVKNQRIHFIKQEGKK